MKLTSTNRRSGVERFSLRLAHLASALGALAVIFGLAGCASLFDDVADEDAATKSAQSDESAAGGDGTFGHNDSDSSQGSTGTGGTGTQTGGGGTGNSSGGTGGTPPASGGGSTGSGGGVADGGEGETVDPTEPGAGSGWIQLSPDDSTSMASAQMYKASAYGWGWSLKTHEFINYYDPPRSLFDSEGWTRTKEVAAGIEVGIKGQLLEVEPPVTTPTPEDAAPEGAPQGSSDAMDCGQANGFDDATGGAEEVPCEPQSEPTTTVAVAQADVLFQMRAAGINSEDRRPWNVFLCVDVSGSMEGDKIAYVRDALAQMLTHFQADDRVTLITFESEKHDVFIDKSFGTDEALIRQEFGRLRAGGSTNMIAGLNRVYELAQQNFKTDMLQRVLLFSDGNANVGDTDISTFARLTRINGQEGVYLSGVGVGMDYDWRRMNDLTDAGKGAHVFLPSREEVSLIFGDYFPKLMEVAADSIAIEMELPAGIRLSGFSGEEVSTDPEHRVQNVILAAGDDLTFLARFDVLDLAALDSPTKLTVRLRPLGSSEEVSHTEELATFRELFSAQPSKLFERTRIVDQFASWAVLGQGDAASLANRIAAYGELDWGLQEISQLLSAR